VLGKGSFGKVMLVRYKGSSELHAMKTLRKEALIRRNQVCVVSFRFVDPPLVWSVSTSIYRLTLSFLP